MRATDEMISWQSFPLSNLDNYNNSSESMRSVWPGVGVNVVEMNGNEHWRYYNDSKLKFGWILEASQHTVAASCPQVIRCVIRKNLKIVLNLIIDATSVEGWVVCDSSFEPLHLAGCSSGRGPHRTDILLEVLPRNHGQGHGVVGCLAQ